MSEEKKEGCCSSGNSGCGCCAGIKKLVIGLLIGILIFVAGMMFAKSCPLAGGSKMCPMPKASN